MKHTPGPWSAGGGSYIPITAVRNGKHCQIGRAESCGSHNLPSEEVEANASLMAAALDLRWLADLGFQLSTYAAAIRWNPQETNTPEFLEGLRKFIEQYQEAYRLAIAKAEGRS